MVTFHFPLQQHRLADIEGGQRRIALHVII